MDYEFTFEPRSELELTGYGAIRIDVKQVGRVGTHHNTPVVTFRLANLTGEELADLQYVIKQYLKANTLPVER